MKLQGKAILAFNVLLAVACAIVGVLNILLAVACVIVGVLGYFTADHGFGFALEEKAVHDLEEINAVLEARYPGAWESKPDGLYKGGKKFNDDNKLLDELGQLSGNNVTMFNKDTRVATTFQDAAGKRPVGTKASEAIIKTVLQEGKSFSGYAEVLGNRYLSAYKPLKNQNGQVVGMLFMGIPTKELDEIQSGFIRTIAIAVIVLLVVIGAISWFVIGRVVKQINGQRRDWPDVGRIQCHAEKSARIDYPDGKQRRAGRGLQRRADGQLPAGGRGGYPRRADRRRSGGRHGQAAVQR